MYGGDKSRSHEGEGRGLTNLAKLIKEQSGDGVKKYPERDLLMPV